MIRSLSWLTSNTPRHLPSRPKTPASSRTSRMAVSASVSFGSTPPPGTIQNSGYLLELTRSTYKWNKIGKFN